MTSSSGTKPFRFDWAASGLPDPRNLLPKLPDCSVPPPLVSGVLATPTEEAVVEELRRQGPYEALLGSPLPLYQDYVADPKKYDELTGALLTDLVNTGRRPTSAELIMLDRAFYTFYETPRSKRKPPQGKPTAEVEEADEESVEPFGWL